MYASMKAAVEHLTKTLALEWSPRRIRVNTLAPDGIPTPGDADTVAEVAGGYDELAALIPLGLGTPDDCAVAAVSSRRSLALCHRNHVARRRRQLRRQWLASRPERCLATVTGTHPPKTVVDVVSKTAGLRCAPGATLTSRLGGFPA